MQQPVWVDAMVEEYDSIIRNSVWDVIPRPQGKLVVSSKWLYKVKQVADGSVEKHKASFVARGFSQVEGINYDETFGLVPRYSSIKSMLALSAQMGWKIHQMDVKTTFLNGKIEEEVYIEQPEGFETFNHESHVCRLKRAFDGLKQAPRAWYTKIDRYFTRLGFTKSEADVNLYHIMVEGKPLIVFLYVDDQILTGKYANEILKRFHMEKCNPMQIPLAGNWRKEDATSGEVVATIVYWQLVGSLMYLVNTRSDLCFAVNQLSQAMVHRTKLFWSPSDRKSTYGGIFNLGSTAVSWYSRKQRSVVLSSAEAKYMVASQAACEAIWMQKILLGFFGQRMDPTVIYRNNQSCIKLSKKSIFHDRSKHIDIRYHHLRDCVVKRIMLLLYVSTKEQDVDILTKALSKCKFEFHRNKIGVTNNLFLVEREC
eukprot:PITA_17403